MLASGSFPSWNNFNEKFYEFNGVTDIIVIYINKTNCVDNLFMTSTC